MVNLTIDGLPVTVPAGTSILNAAASIGIEIPVVCYHPHLTANGLCRVCSVDVGRRLQAAACVTAVAEGMVVNTRTKDVLTARRTILEMLNSAVDLTEAPHLQDLMLEYDADTERFDGMERRESPVHDDNPFYLRDYNKCINCWRCVQVCAEDAQYTFALNFDGRGFPHPDRHLRRRRHDGYDVCLLRSMRRRLPHQRTEAQAAIPAGAGRRPRRHLPADAARWEAEAGDDGGIDR
jgi:NADH dehydrogenase/NADH:ubiquinone oxidoreductase subunit G